MHIVGIGTAAPTQKLEVNGQVKATSFAGDGSALTAIVVPAAQWASPGTIGSTAPSTGAFTSLTATSVTATSTTGTALASSTSGALTADTAGASISNSATSGTAGVQKSGLEIQSTGNWNGAGSKISDSSSG